MPIKRYVLSHERGGKILVKVSTFRSRWQVDIFSHGIGENILDILEQLTSQQVDILSHERGGKILVKVSTFWSSSWQVRKSTFWVMAWKETHCQCINLLEQLTGQHIEPWERRQNSSQHVDHLQQLSGQHVESWDEMKHISQSVDLQEQVTGQHVVLFKLQWSLK